MGQGGWGWELVSTVYSKDKKEKSRTRVIDKWGTFVKRSDYWVKSLPRARALTSAVHKRESFVPERALL